MTFTMAYNNATTRLESAQKKANVLYVQNLLRLGDAAIVGHSKDNTFFVDQEMFVIGNPDGVILIKTQIVSTDRRSPDYIWVSKWLAGLKLPLKL